MARYKHYDYAQMKMLPVSYAAQILPGTFEHTLNRPLPKAITVDHGTEFTSKSLDEWAWNSGVKLDFIRPGKPTEKAFIESFNGRLRDECLNVNEFVSIEDARRRIEDWRQDYNHHRPHSSPGHLTPNEFAMQGRETALEAAKL